MRLQTFCTMVLSQHAGILGQDIDRKIPALVQQRLADGTAVDIARVAQTSLNAFEGFLWDESARGKREQLVPWITSVVRYGRYRDGFGQQYCPLCLAEDTEPYFRRQWRLSISVACLKHQIYLNDACPFCARPIVFHTGDFNQRFLPSECPITLCGYCKQDLRGGAYDTVLPVESRLLDFQRQIFTAITEGFGKGFPGAENYSFLFFSGLRRIVRLLVSHGRPHRLRDYLLTESGALSFSPRANRPRVIFEELRVGDRAETLTLAIQLLEDWPMNFIEACKRSKVSSSYITGSKQKLLPYWFSHSIQEHLYDEDYSPTQTERQAVIDYLLKHDIPVNENEIRRWLGLSHSSLITQIGKRKSRWNPRGPSSLYQ